MLKFDGGGGGGVAGPPTSWGYSIPPYPPVLALLPPNVKVKWRPWFMGTFALRGCSFLSSKTWDHEETRVIGMAPTLTPRTRFEGPFLENTVSVETFSSTCILFSYAESIFSYGIDHLTVENCVWFGKDHIRIIFKINLKSTLQTTIYGSYNISFTLLL